MSDPRSCPEPLASLQHPSMGSRKGAPGHGGRGPLRGLRGHPGPCPFCTSSSPPPPTQPEISSTQRFPRTKLYAVPPVPLPLTPSPGVNAALRPLHVLPGSGHGTVGGGGRTGSLGCLGPRSRYSFPFFLIPPILNCPPLFQHGKEVRTRKKVRGELGGRVAV